MFIIGIAGGTGSGKTTVVRKLIERLPKGEVVVIPQDSYYKDSSHVPAEERQNINFDHPDAFEWPLLAKHIEQLKKGQAVEQPIYDYITSSRLQETVHVEPKEIIIVEGIMTFVDPVLTKCFDIKIFVDTDADIRFIRRLLRDVEERGRTVPSVVEQYCTTVKPMHEKYVEPSKKNADIIVLEGGHNQVALDLLIHKIADFIGE